MYVAEQGDLLKINGVADPAIVVSNNPFNRLGKVMVCPIRKDVQENPLHIEINAGQVEGYVLCEQVKYIDLSSRSATKISSANYFDILNISDAVMGIFDFQDM